jgi:dipeptidyl aminopeptidase/acylaminoacyl peptidase
MPRRHPFTSKDLWALPRVGGPAPSPDGREFVVPVTTHALESNEGTTRLWRIPAGATNAGAGGPGDPAEPLTSPDMSATQPVYSPDSKRLAFVRKPAGAKVNEKAKRGPRHLDRPQLYVMSLAGGEPERVTDFPLGITNPRWFPDGRRMAFLAPVYADHPTLEATAKHMKEREDDPVKASVTEDRIYRFWDRWLTDGVFHHIFVIDLDSRATFDLTPAWRRWFDLMDPSDEIQISPDGREIAFSSSRTDPPYDPLVWGVFTVPVPSRIGPSTKAGRVNLISRGDPADSMRPIYSPDGRYLVYGMQREIDFYADRVRLVAVDRRTRARKVLTESWDRSAMAWTFGEEPTSLFLLAEESGRTAFFSLDLEAALRDPARNPPSELVRGGTFSAPQPAGGRLFASVSTLTAPPEAVSFDLESRALTRHTGFTDRVMSGIETSRVEEMIFDGAGGDPVQMYLVHPPRSSVKGARAGEKKRLPLVHMIHGGPHGVFGDQWHWRWNALAFAAPGYLAALVNFHGSTSWGQDFAASILGRWGDQPYTDIMAATDRLVAEGLADERRMAATGGSYGGYLAAWIASQTDRFACVINHAGVADLLTEFASDVTQGRARSMGGEPWDGIERIDRWDPVRHASGFKSPMLVVHGERDYRVPHAQALEIYNIYKAKKLPARLVFYPDENHWILKPKNSIHWYGEVLGWLDRWIGSRRGPARRVARRRKERS